MPKRPAKAAAPAAVPPPHDDCEVENILLGTTLSLGDGRVLLFGEKAVVEPALADFLRERGQVA